MDMESSRIRRVSVLAWTLCCCPVLRKQRQGKKYWILEPAPELFLVLMEAKTDAADFTALEIQEESADMARRSVAYNHLEDKIKVVIGDIRDASNIFGASSFHVITTNPPYMIGTHGENSPSTAKAIARHEVLCTLDDILRESAKMLMPGGRFYMVHRPFRLAEIMSKMVEYKIEPKRMRLVYPYIDKEPNMVLIEGLRGGKSRVTRRSRSLYTRSRVCIRMRFMTFMDIDW